MKIDYKNQVIEFDNPGEKAEYDKHMAEYGPGTNPPKVHPLDCEFCKKMGWPTWPGTDFYTECEKRYPTSK